jgi:membrane protease YdiL (CAAX protease family)
MRISFPGVLFIFYCINRCIFDIAAALRQGRRESPAVPVKKSYAPAIIMTAFSAGFALLTAAAADIPVMGSSRIEFKPVSLGLVFLILELGLDSLEWRVTPKEKKKRVINYLPRTARERICWVFLSIVSGVGEEIMYRGVLFGILFRVTGNFWSAAAISAVLFALIHFSQGLPALISLIFVALGLQWLVKISGGLYIAMGVHFIHNCFNGLVWGWLIKPGVRD